MGDQNLDREDSPVSTDEIAPPAEGTPGVESLARLAAVTAERDRLASDKAELEDRLLRRQAEFENFRRRTDRDRSDFVQYASMESVRELIPVLDDFERALKTQPADSGFAKGVELIYQRLFDILKKMGLEPIDTSGKKFDPHLHQAVDRVHTQDAEEDTILEEYQRGYNFKGKLLRPSMVKVAVR